MCSKGKRQEQGRGEHRSREAYCSVSADNALEAAGLAGPSELKVQKPRGEMMRILK